MKTRKDLEQLKKSWDRGWDIESTEGFEEYHDELLFFRLSVEKENRDKAARHREANISRVLALGKERVESAAIQILSADSTGALGYELAILRAVKLLEAIDSGNW
jgi:hypothetical protein